jgi:hypothetical protein
MTVSTETKSCEGGSQQREVTVLRYADRHAELHGREFAQVREVVVRDGDPAEMVSAAVTEAALDLGGRFAVLVEPPHDSESASA